MDFFSRQDAARKRTRLLVFLFILSVAAIIGSVYLVSAAVFTSTSTQQYPLQEGQAENRLWNEELFLLVSGLVLAVISLGSGYKIAQLRAGGHVVAESLGGRRIAPDSPNFKERRILNVVEEMAIASGIPVPPVYVLPEQGINAFAAGFKPADAVIGVSQGMLDLLTRDEQQGVIAHEFSHILNGDMRMNIRLMGVIHGILVISMIGYIIMRTGGRTAVSSKKEGAAVGAGLALFGLALYVIGYVGIFFGNLLKSAVSRQREYLADASAVQFTRNPDGIGMALKKIGGLSYGSRIRHPRASECSHLFFGAISRGSLFATHPPLVERIFRLDPQFDGRFPKVLKPADREDAPKKPSSKKRKQPLDMIPIPGIPDAARYPVLAHLAQEPASIQELAGAPHPEHLDTAREILERIPQSLRDACRNPVDAQAVAFSLVMDKDPAKQAPQWDILEQQATQKVFEEIKTYYPFVAMLTRQEKLPLAELAIAGLRNLESTASAAFRKTLQALIDADQEIDLFEYTLGRMVERYLAESREPRGRQDHLVHKAADAAGEIALVLSTLARAGQDSEEQVLAAFKSGTGHFSRYGLDLQLIPSEACTLASVDQALVHLERLTPGLKKAMLTACFACITHDGNVTPDEGELFRATALALECPIPPWIGHTETGNTNGAG